MKCTLPIGGFIAITAALQLAILTMSWAPLAAQTPGTSTLRVRISGARNAKGRIAVALFRDANGFPSDASKAAGAKRIEIDSKTLTAEVVFTGIPPGVYAVSVFHDENMNGKLDTSFLGIPKEGYGASNNPKKRMGPPEFEQAKFPLTQTEYSVDIKLVYW